MTERRHARILAMQALCQYEVLQNDFSRQLDDFLADENPPRAAQTFARKLFRLAIEHTETIDQQIQAAVEHWNVSRLAMVDRNILRVAVCELKYASDTPPAVLIDEAVEIAKTFGAADSPAFINGVLDAICKGPAKTEEAADSPTDTPTAEANVES